MGLAWAGEFLEDAFILGVQRRDTLFYNEYVVEKYGSFSLLRNEIQ